MDWILISKLLLILILIVGNAFFVGSEIALTSARRSRIKQLASTGNKAAKIVQVLHNEPERFYSVTQIGITLVSLALGAIGIITLTQIMDPGIEAAFGLLGDGEEIAHAESDDRALTETMLQAHHELITLKEENRLLFDDVIELLQRSLDKPQV